MANKNNVEEELDCRAYDVASELWHAWEDYYSEWFTLDEYFVRVAAYLKDHFDTIKEEIENADNEE